MNGLLERLKELEEKDDKTLIEELNNTLSDQSVLKKLNSGSDKDRQAVHSLLNKLLERVIKHQEKLKEAGEKSIARIDELKKMSEACIAYTKAKRTD